MASSLVRYSRKMGLRKAVALYAMKLFRSSGEIAVRLPDIATPVWARFGTSDLGTFREVLIDEGYSFPTEQTPRLIIDAGANVGYTSVYFANRFPDATIIAVEPDRGNFRMLQRNTAAYPKVRCVQAGVWSRDCFLKVSNPEAGACAFQVEETEEPANAIPAVTLTTLLDSSGHLWIDILKLDVEGAEKQLFSAPDCARWLARTDLMMIELHDRLFPGCEMAMLKAVGGLLVKRSQRGRNTFLTRAAV